MNLPGSVFILDVTDSKSISPPSLLTQYLRDMVSWLRELSKSIPGSIALTHRFGDEILLVARGFETAYILAFYIMMTWPFSQRPYFGISFGDLLTEFPTSEALETWNSPVVKWARVASDRLKQEKPMYRQWLLFGHDPEATTGDAEIIQVLNEYAMIQDRFIKSQHEAARLASSLYTISGIQEWVAKQLQKDPSTISRQIRHSDIDLLLAVKKRIVKILKGVMLSETFGHAFNEMTATLEREDEKHWLEIELRLQCVFKEHVETLLTYAVGSDK
ncbi:MAG: hypothetical protein K6T83_05420 [Alicyclobacillus sp.]|nr:hypothetical protein [Alicyclobacillus sp.]